MVWAVLLSLAPPFRVLPFPEDTAFSFPLLVSTMNLGSPQSAFYVYFTYKEMILAPTPWWFPFLAFFPSGASLSPFFLSLFCAFYYFPFKVDTTLEVQCLFAFPPLASFFAGLYFLSVF